MPEASGNTIVLSAVGSVTSTIVSKSFAVAPSNITFLPCPNTTDEPNTVKPVVDSTLLEPAGFSVVTPAAKGPTTFKLSFTSI